jgi:ankyrin repeat protein
MISRRTPLANAAAAGQLRMIQLLIENGADVNLSQSLDSLSPLGEAITRKQLEAARMLLEAGADPNVRFKGDSLLQWASKKKKSQFTELLIKYGAK